MRLMGLTKGWIRVGWGLNEKTEGLDLNWLKALIVD